MVIWIFWKITRGGEYTVVQGGPLFPHRKGHCLWHWAPAPKSLLTWPLWVRDCVAELYSPSQTDGGQSPRTLNVIKPGFVIWLSQTAVPWSTIPDQPLTKRYTCLLVYLPNRHLWNAYPIPGMVLSKGYVTGGIRHGNCPFIHPKGDFLVVQSSGVSLPMQGTQVWYPSPGTRIPRAAG